MEVPTAHSWVTPQTLEQGALFKGGLILSRPKAGLKPAELHGFTPPETLPRVLAGTAAGEAAGNPGHAASAAAGNIRAPGTPSAFALSPPPPARHSCWGTCRGDGSGSPGFASPPAIAERSCCRRQRPGPCGGRISWGAEAGGEGGLGGTWYSSPSDSG